MKKFTFGVALVYVLTGLALHQTAFAQTSLLPDVRAERAKYGARPTEADLCTMLNAIAAKHAADGWGLSRKDGGNGCFSQPHGFRIALDILHHKPTDTLYDVFGSAGEASTPQWSIAEHHHDPSRPWVAPVGVSQPPPPPPPPSCDVCEAVRDTLKIENATLRDALAVAERHMLALQQDVDLTRARALAAEAEVERLNQQPTPRCRAKAPGWLRIGCEIVR